MPSSRTRPARRRDTIAGLLFLAVLLVAGLLLGAKSTLTLRRDASGAVTAVNAWRFAGRVTLISHSVTGLREVRFEADTLSDSDRRSSSGRSLLGPAKRPEHAVLIGSDGQFSYSYRDDVGLIQGFLRNPRNAALTLTHPVDIRRTVASWILLTVVVLGITGWIWKLILGRDPLAGAERSVTPLPPAIGQTLFVAGFAVIVWFFLAGQNVFGPLATRKVKLLTESSTHDDAAGIARSVHEGVDLDCRDGQGMTALMLAVRAGAAHAVDALLAAGANANLRTSADETALLMAIHLRHPALAAQLFHASPDLSVADSDGRTALHAAAELGDVPTLRLLLSAAANSDVNQPDNYGWTPLFFAAASGRPEAVQTLLAAGADPQRKLPDGRTAADVGRTAGEAAEAYRKPAP
jgi:hypothetical protein